MEFKTPSLQFITFAILFVLSTATHAFSSFGLACTAGTSITANQITNQWAIQLIPGTDPVTLAKEYDAKLLGPIGSLKDTWLLLRPDFNLPDNRDPLRKDTRVIWLERQITHQLQKRPPKPDNSYIK